MFIRTNFTEEPEKLLWKPLYIFYCRRGRETDRISRNELMLHSEYQRIYTYTSEPCLERWKNFLKVFTRIHIYEDFTVDLQFFFFIFGGHMSFGGATDTPVLDFW